MWSLDEIAIEIVDADDTAIFIEVITPAGRLDLMANIRRVGRVLYCDRAHIQGLHAGALGRAGLNAIGRKLLVEADVDQIVVEGGARTTGAGKGRTPRPIRFPR